MYLTWLKLYIKEIEKKKKQLTKIAKDVYLEYKLPSFFLSAVSNEYMSLLILKILLSFEKKSYQMIQDHKF